MEGLLGYGGLWGAVFIQMRAYMEMERQLWLMVTEHRVLMECSANFRQKL